MGRTGGSTRYWSATCTRSMGKIWAVGEPDDAEGPLLKAEPEGWPYPGASDDAPTVG